MKLCYFFQAARFLKPYNETSFSMVYSLIEKVDNLDTKQIVIL